MRRIPNKDRWIRKKGSSSPALRAPCPVTSGELDVFSLSPRGRSGERAGERGHPGKEPPLPDPLLPRASGREGEEAGRHSSYRPKTRTKFGEFSPPSDGGENSPDFVRALDPVTSKESFQESRKSFRWFAMAYVVQKGAVTGQGRGEEASLKDSPNFAGSRMKLRERQ